MLLIQITRRPVRNSTVAPRHTKSGMAIIPTRATIMVAHTHTATPTPGQPHPASVGSRSGVGFPATAAHKVLEHQGLPYSTQADRVLPPPTIQSSPDAPTLPPFPAV